MPVNTPQAEAAELLPSWETITTALSPRLVRKAGPAILPKLKAHEQKPELYDAYCQRAVYVPVMARAKRAFEGLVFRIPPDVKGVDAAAQRDVTGTGMTLRAFARQVFGTVVAPGRAGLLTDMAPASEKVRAAPRAFVSLYSAVHLLEAHEEPVEELADRLPIDALLEELGVGEGDRVISRVRLLEPLDLPRRDDPYRTQRVEQARVITLEAMAGPKGPTLGQVHQLWRERIAENGEVEKGKFERYGEPIVPLRRNSPVPFVPFVVANQEACGVHFEEPALLGFAEINLSQFRTSADLENARFKMGHPQLCVWGADSGGEPLLIGDGVWTSTNAQAHAEVLQVADQFAGLERAIAEKDEQMLAEGARLMAKREGEADTATAATIKAAGERSLLMAMTETTSEALSLSMAYRAWWMAGTGTVASWRERVKVTLNTQFDEQALTGAEAEAWLRVQIGGGVSRRTLRHLYRKGGVYPEGWSDTNEAGAIEQDRAAAMADLDGPDGEDVRRMQ